MKKSIKTPSVKKMQSGGTTTVKGSRPGLGVFKTTKQRTTSGGLFQPYKYTTTSIDTTGYSKNKPTYKLKTEEGEGDKTGSKTKSIKSKTISRKQVPNTLKTLGKANFGEVLGKVAKGVGGGLLGLGAKKLMKKGGKISKCRYGCK